MSRLTDYSDVVSQVRSNCLNVAKRPWQEGEKDGIILDPGIGFAKNALQSLEILKNITDFTCPSTRCWWAILEKASWDTSPVCPSRIDSRKLSPSPRTLSEGSEDIEKYTTLKSTEESLIY